jgi:signal transduction histidine kinase
MGVSSSARELAGKAVQTVRDISLLLRPALLDDLGNGRGLELNTKGMPGRNAGLGILGVRERAARVGGALALESSPGRGTRICLQIPLAGLAGSSVQVAAEAGINA